jgi:hypothetical protein
MLNQSGFDFSRRQSVPRNIDDVINTAADPVVSFVISASPIASELSNVNA